MFNAKSIASLILILLAYGIPVGAQEIDAKTKSGDAINAETESSDDIDAKAKPGGDIEFDGLSTSQSKRRLTVDSALTRDDTRQLDISPLEKAPQKKQRSEQVEQLVVESSVKIVSLMSSRFTHQRQIFDEPSLERYGHQSRFQVLKSAKSFFLPGFRRLFR